MEEEFLIGNQSPNDFITYSDSETEISQEDEVFLNNSETRTQANDHTFSNTYFPVGGYMNISVDSVSDIDYSLMPTEEIKQMETSIAARNLHQNQDSNAKTSDRYPFKNFPSHVISAIRKGFRFLRDNKPGYHLQCVYQVLQKQKPSFNEENLGKLLKSIKSTFKTFEAIEKSIERYLERDEGDLKAVIVLSEMIFGLLSEGNQADFEYWIENSKMNDATKKGMRENKNELCKKLMLLLDRLILTKLESLESAMSAE